MNGLREGFELATAALVFGLVLGAFVLGAATPLLAAWVLLRGLF